MKMQINKPLILTLCTIFFGAAFCGCQSTTNGEAAKVKAANYAGVPATDYTVVVSGRKGVTFTGTIVTDGVKQVVSGVVPESDPVIGNEVVCNLKKGEEKG